MTIEVHPDGAGDWPVLVSTEPLLLPAGLLILTNTMLPEREVMPFRLTRFQYDVLCCLSEARQDNEIARQLSYSPKTVKNMMSELLRMMGARHRTDLAVLTLRLRVFIREWPQVMGKHGSQQFRCKRGHLVTLETTRMDKRGRRRCKLCRATWYERRRTIRNTP